MRCVRRKECRQVKEILKAMNLTGCMWSRNVRGTFLLPEPDLLLYF